MGILKNIFKNLLSAPQDSTDKSSSNTPVDSQQKSKEKKHKVAGVKYYTDNVLSLARLNPDYSLKKNEIIQRELDRTIYQYIFSPGKTELIHEPTNPHDPNAIKVIIDGKHVGYIKAGSCKHILNLINDNRIEKINSEIYGGKYKCLCLDGESDFVLEKGETEYKINVSIIER